MVQESRLVLFYLTHDFSLTQQVVKVETKGRTYYVDEVDEEKRPFRALLDVGIRSTSTG